MQNTCPETARTDLKPLEFSYGPHLLGLANVRALLVVGLILSLISTGFFTTAIGIHDAFAKKSSKKSDTANRVTGGEKGSDIGSDIGTDNSLQQMDKPPTTTEDQQVAESSVPPPLPTETPIHNKVAIINFDDSHESDFTYAKPILDKYGFKATFFEVCNWVEAGYHESDVSITWPEIAALQQDGMDIEAHTMTHPNLNHKSQSDLDYEIGQSKQCLENHGFNTTIFAYPNGEGSDNPKVVNTVAKYYDLARSDSKSALTFLHCNGDNNEQTDCSTQFSDGTLTPSNRYSINSWAHKHIENSCPPDISASDTGTCATVRHEYDNAQMFHKFVSAVNNQSNYNNDGIVRTIPIIVYHTLVNYSDLSESNRPIDTTVNLFDAEMRYLYSNGFKVITMSGLGYDPNSRTVYIKAN